MALKSALDLSIQPDVGMLLICAASPVLLRRQNRTLFFITCQSAFFCPSTGSFSQDQALINKEAAAQFNDLMILFVAECVLK